MLLLDTHVLLWLVRGQFLAEVSVSAIAAAQNTGTLYASAITAWELGAAELKRSGRPEIGMSPAPWFQFAVRLTRARLATITLEQFQSDWKQSD